MHMCPMLQGIKIDTRLKYRNPIMYTHIEKFLSKLPSSVMWFGFLFNWALTGRLACMAMKSIALQFYIRSVRLSPVVVDIPLNIEMLSCLPYIRSLAVNLEVLREDRLEGMLNE
ncbi:hypothetical protein FBU59_000382 [Linderina macrospora]|uniref:Uncharacterized protein n=1 Tax=Linderina macrospora TaxID=4868 RepID=A0ACC1JH31_9FUNG|nr:hypothetical protein FBU59_000382 [Linderina macrospora]